MYIASPMAYSDIALRMAGWGSTRENEDVATATTTD